ncbi:MAG: hypothetical protein HQL99_00325 [Magnetococcales bacterium]|nr:hypothetical protein [Magnetococcales bacterium]
MRILIFLTLGIVSLVGLFYGVRLIWLAIHPDSAPKPLPVPEWLDERASRWILIGGSLLLVILALVDIVSTQKDPGEHQPPPTVSSTPLTPRAPH